MSATKEHYHDEIEKGQRDAAPRLYKIKDWQPGLPDVYFTCPGCGCDHGVWLKHPEHKGASWDFNGDFNKPTFSPSIKVTYPTKDKMHICHSFVRNGKIEYLSDCTHELAGKTIELPEV